MVIVRHQNKITDFFMILAWDSPFNVDRRQCYCKGLTKTVTRVGRVDEHRFRPYRHYTGLLIYIIYF